MSKQIDKPRQRSSSKRLPELAMIDLVKIQIPIFDEMLAEKSVPLATRPYRATDMLLRYCVEPSDGAEIPKATDMAYGAFYYPILAWYKRAYGKTFVGPKPLEHDLVGVALLRGALVELRIPTVVNVPRDDDALIDLQFPLALRPEENALTFLYPRQRLSGFRGAARIKFIAQLTETISSLRRIFNLTVGIKTEHLEAHELRDSLLEHIKSTAVRATSGKSIAFSLFDLRMCCEIALKLHLIQRNRTFKRTHNFEPLLSAASSEIRKLFDGKLPKELSSYTDLNARRYGSKLGISTTQFFEVYKACLPFLEGLLGVLKREVVLSNAMITMRRLPWALAGPSAFGYPDI